MRMALANGTLSLKIITAALAATLCLGAGAADARPKKQSKAKASASQTANRSTGNADSGWQRGQSAIVIDANTGKVLYEDNADAMRHPASVTKVMTLYMLFEQLEAGRLKLDSDLPVSQRAAAQSPSKLNLRPGSTIEVEDAIKAIVTRSANDVAVVVAEAIGGDESTFAAMMTRKARQLGMENTQFRNASGLPNKGQLTTARDLATLGIAIQDRFPRYYKYFSTRTFYYRGQAIANHNRMFGRLEGVDGIKTGYTNASGFNLLTSVHDDDKFIIGVVMGGSSAASRDARMERLIEGNLDRAYAGRRQTPKLTEVAAATPDTPTPAPRREETVVAPLPMPQRLSYAAADPVTTAAIAPRQAPGSTEPIKPTTVKTTSISRPAVQAAPAPAFTSNAPVLPPVTLAADPAPAAMTVPASLPSGAPQTLQAQARALAAPAVAPVQQPVRTAAAGPVALPETVAPVAAPAVKPVSSTPAQRSGWMIQIGAFGGEKEAKAQLDLAQSKVKSLGGAEPFVEKATKGASDIYRARFAGLDAKSAKEACRLLQRNDFACMTIRN